MSTRVHKSRRLRRWLLVPALIICGAAALLGWRFVSSARNASASPAGPRWVMPVSRVVKNQVNATGTVQLKTGAEVRVGAQLSGIVRRLFVTVGSTVRQGQVIAEIDARPIEAKLQQAKAQLAQARVTLAKAAMDASRADQLYAAGIISKQQYQDAEAARDAAKAAVDVAQSGVEGAGVDLAYVEIRAPIGGTIASVSTRQGETVAASFATPTFVTIIQKDALEVVALVDEADIGNIRPGATAAFTTETWPDREFAGTVERIDPVGTIISGVVNYQVMIVIRKDVSMLKPDMTTNVNIVTAQHEAMLVPFACVRHDAEGSFVYERSTSGQPVRQSVTMGSRSAGDVEILQGLDSNVAVLE